VKGNSKINILIVGNGHYATGSTVLDGKIPTDKDFGVLLPSALELRHQGIVDQIYLAARDGRKMDALKKKLDLMKSKFNWDTQIRLFPEEGKVDEKAYAEAMKQLPRPGAVLIAVPDKLHKEIILEAIKNKHHFLVVKPVVTNIKDLYDIIKEQEKAGVFGMVDYHKCFDEANILLLNEYKEGKYGQLQHVFTKQTQRRDMLRIYGSWLSGSNTNVNHYLGSHYIQMVGFITGATPISVRATGQYGVAKKDFSIDTYDLIETQVVWKAKDKSTFVSYHLAGWSDPSETASMTYQEMHLIGTNAIVDSEQRFRGHEAEIVGKGREIINPYFFNLNNGLDGKPNLETKYGFRSIKAFVNAALSVEGGASPKEFNYLPTIKESMNVTAILEAADKSLRKNSAVIPIKV